MLEEAGKEGRHEASLSGLLGIPLQGGLQQEGCWELRTEAEITSQPVLHLPSFTVSSVEGDIFPQLRLTHHLAEPESIVHSKIQKLA